MEADLKSFKKHDSIYKTLGHKLAFAKMKVLEDLDFFNVFGFKEAIGKNPSIRALHIDIGSGAGWLIRHTAPIFKKILAVEPSVAATDISKAYNSEFSNIEYLNQDMVEALLARNFVEPYFVTTSAVFCHIEDFHVKSVLEIINKAPKDSILLFYEAYDTNIQQPFWHIRSHEWWESLLPNWQLQFLEIRPEWEGKIEKYKKGIYGVCLGKPTALKEAGRKKKIRIFIWHLQGLYYRLRYLLVNFVKRTLRIKEKLV